MDRAGEGVGVARVSKADDAVADAGVFEKLPHEGGGGGSPTSNRVRPSCSENSVSTIASSVELSFLMSSSISSYRSSCSVKRGGGRE